jgi:hypothetical protein
MTAERWLFVAAEAAGAIIHSSFRPRISRMIPDETDP